jgi:hypothetical protein
MGALGGVAARGGMGAIGVIAAQGSVGALGGVSMQGAPCALYRRASGISSSSSSLSLKATMTLRCFSAATFIVDNQWTPRA